MKRTLSTLPILTSALIALSLTACGGGGGGGGCSTGTAPATPAPSIKGDMLALKPSTGWNYQTTFNNNPLTITLYSDPTINGVTALVAAGTTGLVTTVATSTANMQANMVGALGMTVDASGNYNVTSEYSLGSTAAVPGTPLFVPSTLTLGQTWSASGGSATVTNIGVVPGESACPNASSSPQGAQVTYTYPGYSESISYVPGCGITDVRNTTNGADFVLTSVGSYPAIGTLARRAATATWLDTAASLLGQRRNDLPGAHLLRALHLP
ncbi:MAG TPA: hypothetical protein VFN49_13165 [Candidatus Aquilonibacter sp.]|nr:hypothetical protein [Candidatus Aquilonibacter sp.]